MSESAGRSDDLRNSKAQQPGDHVITGDNARLSLSQDEFGLDKITRSIASVLKSKIAADGYCIAIEGEWGAGKTSLVNFVSDELSKEPYLHRLIRFQPWMIGTKEALLASLFSLLTEAIRQYDTDPHLVRMLVSNPTIVDQTIAHLSRYAAHLEQGSQVLDYTAAFDPTGKTKIGAVALKILATLARWIAPKDQSLEELKEKIGDDLRILSNLANGFRITVLIDNLDRLDPEVSCCRF